MNLPQDYTKLKPWQRRQVRNQYIKLQDGKCCYCDQSLDGPPSEEVLSKELNMALFPKNFLTYPHHLHHDHDTGMTLGTLHAYCNGVSWQYEGI